MTVYETFTWMHFLVKFNNVKLFSEIPTMKKSAVQSQELAVDNEKSEKEKKSFIYDKDDEFYSAPAFCYLMHYRNAAIFCGILEIILLIITILVFFSK